MELTKNQKIISKIFEKAWVDAEFRRQLNANPVEAIKQATGESLELPEGRELKVVDQTDAGFVYLNIPPKPNMDEIELTDEQLELVAGGGGDGDVAAMGTGI